MKRVLEVTGSWVRSPLDRSLIVVTALVLTQVWAAGVARAQTAPREPVSLNAGWRFTKGDPNGDSTGLIYDVRPEVRDRRDDRPSDAMPTEAVDVAADQRALKPWVLPTGNDFIKDPPRGTPAPKVTPVAMFPTCRAISTTVRGSA